MPTNAIELALPAKARHIDDFEVGRVLPAPERRMLGPFAFFDHIGPAALQPGRGLDVRPHPHIGLATVTYLFEGAILHRDSLGNEQLITKGAINWMSAGRGIVHSERSPADERAKGPRMHGLQLWVALPRASEESAPSFEHHEEATLPYLTDKGVSLRVLAGIAFGAKSNVTTSSPLFYVDAELEAGARLQVPTEYEERGVYLVDGDATCDGAPCSARTLNFLRASSEVVLEARTRSRIVLLGGDRLDGPRYIWWNFVSSRKERIEEAAHAWKNGEFPPVPGDTEEFIPLHDEPRFPHVQDS